VAGAVSCERPSACHINIKSTVDQRGDVTCRKFLKIAKLANGSGEAIFPTLFQVFTIRLNGTILGKWMFCSMEILTLY
jgi:hypothetical protein